MSVSLGVLRRMVLDYASGRITLRALESWFVPLAWDSDPMDDVANRVLGLLGAADEWSEDELKQRLVAAVMPTRTVGVVPGVRVSGAKRRVALRIESHRLTAIS
jgi:hypothetical protein